MHAKHHHYEILFDVPSRHREAFEQWLSSDAIAWLNNDRVHSFDVFQNDTGLSPEVKFVFGFETVQDWVGFVNSDEHEAATHRLEALVDNRKAVLWQRTTVKMDEPGDEAIPNGGPSEAADRWPGLELVIPQ